MSLFRALPPWKGCTFWTSRLGSFEHTKKLKRSTLALRYVEREGGGREGEFDKQEAEVRVTGGRGRGGKLLNRKGRCV